MADVKSRVSEEEWQLRVDLAACYRLVAHYGWDDLIFTHISARVAGARASLPDQPVRDDVRRGHRVEPGQDRSRGQQDHGEPVRDQPGRLHDPQRDPRRARGREVRAAHAQPQRRRGVGAKPGVLPISQQSIFVLASLGYHDYEGVALHEGEKPRLVRDLGDKSFLMLRNHGLLTVGATIADAFLLMYLFESACTIQLRAQSPRAELITIDPKIVAGATMMAKQVTRAAGRRHSRGRGCCASSTGSIAATETDV